jgi:LAGLIDADG endonuclease
VNKSPRRLVHAFEITQKLDKIVLTSIKYILGISTNVQTKKAGYYSISTTNSRAITNIIKYFHNTMKGMKSLEYRI